MIKRGHYILQLQMDGEWHGLQAFTNVERAETNLMAARSEDPEGEYRLDDRSYEIPDPYEA